MDMQSLSESEVLEKLVTDRRLLAHTLGFLLSGAFPHPEYPYEGGVYFAQNVLREELSLQRRGKPGDIDLLAIPWRNELILYGKSLVLEAKIVRPTLQKPSKNVSKMGVSQCKGLLLDGFPYCGLLHVVITEPLPDKYRCKIPLMKNYLNQNGNPIPTGDYLLVDQFSFSYADRQEGRLAASALPEYAGYKSLSLETIEGKISGMSVGNEREAKRNPNVSSETIQLIRSHFNENKDTYNYVKWIG